jgi:hypothetical protein
MDWILILLLGIVAVVALVVLALRFTKKEVKQIEHAHETTSPHTFEAGKAQVERQVTINPRDQHHQGAHRKIKVESASPADLSNVKPNGANGIEQVLAVVMRPVVRYADSGQDISQFEPPLDITVRFTDADVKATTLDANGLPRLSLGAVYPADGDWKWQRLKTHVSKDGDGGTLQAKLHSLHPDESLIICAP